MPHIIDTGKGHPVVLLHGFCENSAIWNRITPLLSNNFRVLAPDLPGHGKNELPDSIQSLEDVAEELFQWLDTLGIDKFSIIGHSLGGYIALSMLALKPDRITSLCLFHSTAYADSEEKKANRTKTVNFIKKHGDKAFKRNFIPSLYHTAGSWAPELAKMIESTHRDTIIRYTSMMRDRPDRLAVLRQLDRKMIIAGYHDEFIPMEALEALSNDIGEVSYHVLANSGHLGMWEEPEHAARLIAEFLGSES